ncbi:MAG TPA: hypothetical protein DDW76_11105, partial [Cyanobacteria bacterium UBA11369]|nr:hypothetical protein [Cyanobacteria bacterium UBA11369]
MNGEKETSRDDTVRTYAKKPGLYKKSSICQLEIEGRNPVSALTLPSNTKSASITPVPAERLAFAAIQTKT